MYLYFIDLLRCVATALITNSHYNNIWPVAALATGGSIGNTLFFAISGFCLSVTKDARFAKWMKKRVSRLYPAVWIVTLVEFVFLNPSINSLSDVVSYFVFPTQFWFVSAILVFYCLFYVIAKYAHRYINAIIAGVAAVYFLVYFTLVDTTVWSIESDTYFKWIYYFEIMLIAYKMRLSSFDKQKYSTGFSMLICCAWIIVYFGFKFLIDKVQILMWFQFIIHILSTGFMVFCFAWGCSIERALQQKREKKWFKIVSWVGGTTLEIYLVQTFVIRTFESIMFPVNLLVTTAMIILLAYILHTVTNALAKKLKG